MGKPCAIKIKILDKIELKKQLFINIENKRIFAQPRKNEISESRNKYELC